MFCHNEAAVAGAILIVDDEPALRYSLSRAFRDDYLTAEADSVAAAQATLARQPFDLVILDYSMPGGDGLLLLRELAGLDDAPAVIMITAHGSERIAVEAMKAGAYDYLAKPFDLDELRLIVARALERQRLRREVQGLRERLGPDAEFERMTGVSAPMRALFETAARAAQSELPVLLLGESGAGKDLLAQAIHARSRRAAQRFVALNCAALPENLVESELFGYEKGAFTGALAPRPGKFETAHKGTLFLDEIGDMAPATQSKILRAAESGAVERLGANRPVTVDVRIISATNREVDALRADLYYRLAGVTLYLPPLRDRREDIPLLVDRFWREAGKRHQLSAPELTREAILRLTEAPWPGNVRQLRNVVENLYVLSRGERVTAADVDAGLRQDSARPRAATLDPLSEPDYREAKRKFEAAYIARKLRDHNGNITRTAAAIGLERQSLQEKIRRLRLNVQEEEAHGTSTRD
ncbi:MAG: sigma-54 dependent transcriptional regulator [Bryobacteraceae bacterium]|nr:sigma-54 dependent transcriptional regulator [Bryobacteraceae bacterium]